MTKDKLLSIGEVANIVGVPVHTVRFWQQQFSFIKSHIAAGNRRYYDQENINKILKIKELMHDKGMKISGIKRILSGKNRIKNEIDMEDGNIYYSLLAWNTTEKTSNNNKTDEIFESIRKIKLLLDLI